MEQDIAPRTKLDKVKVTVLLPQSDVSELEYIAQLDTSSITEALRRSIKTTALIRRELAKGSQILLKRSGDDTVREIILI